MSKPSSKAIAYAEDAVAGLVGPVQLAVHAAHAPALGLDRSVCLRDVAEWWRDRLKWLDEEVLVDEFTREFGGDS